MHNEFPVPHVIFEHPRFREMKVSTRLLYCYLAKLRNRFGNAEGYFYRSEKMLSEDTGMTTKTIRGAKVELKENGLLKVVRGNHKSTGYRGPDWLKVYGYRDNPKGKAHCE